MPGVVAGVKARVVVGFGFREWVAAKRVAHQSFWHHRRSRVGPKFLQTNGAEELDETHVVFYSRLICLFRGTQA